MDDDVDRARTTALEAFVDEACPISTSTKHRDAAARLNDTFRTWLGPGVPCHMFVAGSYRLGVHTQDADIDAVFVVPDTISRHSVFSGFLRRLEALPGVSDIQPIPNARVPILGFVMDGQEFDLMTCHVPAVHMPRPSELPARDFLLKSYDWMNGADEASILSFHGPRVTEQLLAAAQTHGAHCVCHFQLALRFLRLWAKRRGLYSNKSGYFGGVNLALLTMHVLLRTPRAPAAAIVRQVFGVFAAWRWFQRAPVRLALPDAEEAAVCPVWLRAFEWTPGRTEAMVVLAPCFPRSNTMFSALRHTRDTMCAELRRARDLWEQDPGRDATPWRAVCTPLAALATCPRFVALTVSVIDTPEGRAWQGFVVSQIRYLVELLRSQDTAVKEFRHVPVWVTADSQDAGGARRQARTTYITAEDDGEIRTYLIRVSLQDALTHFAEGLRLHGPQRPPGSSLTAAYVLQDAVPEEAFAPQTRADLLLAALQEQQCRPQSEVDVDPAPGSAHATDPKVQEPEPEPEPATGACCVASDDPAPPDAFIAPAGVGASRDSGSETFVQLLEPHVQTLCRVTDALLKPTAPGPASARSRLQKRQAPRGCTGCPCPMVCFGPSPSPSPKTPRSSPGAGPGLRSGTGVDTVQVLGFGAELFNTAGHGRSVVVPKASSPKPSHRRRLRVRVSSSARASDRLVGSSRPCLQYVCLRTGPGRCVMPEFDVYIGPPWGALQAPWPWLDITTTGCKSVPEYAAWLQTLARTDPRVRQQLAVLATKRVACWCTRMDMCHALALQPFLPVTVV